MNYINEISDFLPITNQEHKDKKLILDFIYDYPDTVLYRENVVGHITSSGFILNDSLDKVLMVHHNIMNTWAWTGGHADGNPDLLAVAMEEAIEETGISSTRPLFNNIASLDVLPVYGHMKNGEYVSTHLHLSVSYLLIADENDSLEIKPDENSGVKWISVSDVNEDNFNPSDTYVYTKLINRAQNYKKHL